MKKIWAIIKLHEGETTQNLLSAVFSKEEFNPQNAILIQDQMAILEVFFEETAPQGIVEAIGGYSDIRCGFGQVSEECLKKAGISLEEHTPQDAEATDESEPLAVDEEATEVTDESETLAEATEAAEATDKVVTFDVAEEAAEVTDESETLSVATEVAEKADPFATGEIVSSTKTGKKKSKAKKNKARKNKPKEEPASGRTKSRKAPDKIPQIDEIANRCTSYQQFSSKVIEWLEVGKRTDYLSDVFEVAAKVEKVNWQLIEKELINKGYNNPSVTRQRASVAVTQKLTEKQIDCSFIALVEYVAKYKSYDFRSNIEEKVREILRKMGIERESTKLQKEITDITIKAVMVERNHVVNLEDVCKDVLGGSTDDEDIWDAKMNFSNFLNDFLREQGMDMMTGEEFIGKLRKAVFDGVSMW